MVFPLEIESLSEDDVWHGSAYLSQKTFYCLREMFTSAKAIQDWFTDCAKIISSSQKKCITWVTPLGLPVTQPYLKMSRKNFQTKKKEKYHMFL